MKNQDLNKDNQNGNQAGKQSPSYGSQNTSQRPDFNKKSTQSGELDQTIAKKSDAIDQDDVDLDDEDDVY